LKVGIIVDDVDQSFLVSNLISNSKDSHLYTIDSLIVNKNSRSDKKSGITKLITLLRKSPLRLFSKVTFRLITILEEFLLIKFLRIGELLKKVGLDEIDLPKVSVFPARSKSGFVMRYSDEDLELISSLGLDMLVRACGAIIRGGILEVCRYGVISFHHGNNDLFRGGPPAFWEVLKRSSTTGFIIQGLGDELDGGDVYFKGDMPTHPFFLANKLRLYK